MMCLIQREAFNLSPNSMPLSERDFFPTSYSFWRIPFLRATRKPYNVIFKIIFTALEILRTNYPGETCSDVSASLILIMASNYISQECSDFEDRFLCLFPLQYKRSLMKQARKCTGSNMCSQCLCAPIKPCKFRGKMHGLSYREQGYLNTCWKKMHFKKSAT